MKNLIDEDPSQHPWWKHVSSEGKQTTLRRRRKLRARNWISSRNGSLCLLLIINAAFLIGIAANGVGPLTLVALFPLVILPSLAAISWWLTWKEFHH